MVNKKIVFIVGAGFSVPGKLPVQNKIINEMISYPEKSFLYESIEASGSVKFLEAYIKVGLFLLLEYLGVDTDEIDSEYAVAVSKLPVREDEKYNLLLPIKEKVRQVLENEINKGRNVCLEDLFTLLDKAITLRENIKTHKYAEIDRLKNFIMRLFIYYFGLSINKHDFNTLDYINVINFINNTNDEITFITTNWDTLFEKYLEKNKTKIDFCLNKPYYSLEGSVQNKKANIKIIKYIKVHGSLNWFRCLNCGTLLIKKKDALSNFVFENNIPEKCSSCGHEAEENTIQLQPEIITPTMIKTFTSQLYLNLWKVAYDELSHADEVIFVGYSLPIADFEFRYLLKKSISKNAKILILLSKKDDPKNISSDIENKNIFTSLLPEQRYIDLFGGNSLVFNYEGFGNYFNMKNT